MREIRSSGSVEGVTCNRDPYSDSLSYSIPHRAAGFAMVSEIRILDYARFNAAPASMGRAAPFQI
jgi:hypothetical protein